MTLLARAQLASRQMFLRSSHQYLEDAKKIPKRTHAPA